jgi:glutamate synthase (NADPH/NADH) small chain
VKANVSLASKGEPVAIGRLERFVADYASTHNLEKSLRKQAGVAKKQKVAIIGSGPSGLTAAGDLAKLRLSGNYF